MVLKYFKQFIAGRNEKNKQDFVHQHIEDGALDTLEKSLEEELTKDSPDNDLVGRMERIRDQVYQKREDSYDSLTFTGPFGIRLNVDEQLKRAPNFAMGFLDSKIGDLYFKTKKFEKGLYEKLGVKYFKKLFMATIGRAFRLVGADKIPSPYFMSSKPDRRFLEFTEKGTRYNECLHTIGAPLGIYAIPILPVEGIAFTILNTYLIMMQRHNRTRFEKILAKKDRQTKEWEEKTHVIKPDDS
jgi:hypothetical protein